MTTVKLSGPTYNGLARDLPVGTLFQPDGWKSSALQVEEGRYVWTGVGGSTGLRAWSRSVPDLDSKPVSKVFGIITFEELRA